MDGSITPLSASEEITLRRVHYGIAKPSAMVAHDVTRLKELGLIEPRGFRLALTITGRRYVGNLEDPDERFNRLIVLLGQAETHIPIDRI